MIVTPLFSIIIPTYNRAHLILETLNSVKNQKYSDFEVIIIDDGSEDNTKEIVELFIKDNDLKCWYYFFKTNGERGAARNFGVRKSKGKFVTFLDSDDLVYENHLLVASKFIDDNSYVEIFHSAYEFKKDKFDIGRKVIYKNKNLNSSILKGNILSCFGVFLKKDIALSYPFDEERSLSGSEDWLLWLTLLPKYTFYLQDNITGCMIEHTERSVLNFSTNQLKNRSDLLFQKLKNNSDFVTEFGIKKVNEIYAHMLTYGALHLMLSGKKKESIVMYLSGIRLNYLEIFQKRTLGILKNMFKSK